MESAMDLKRTKFHRAWLWLGAVAVLIVVAVALSDRWLPQAQNLLVSMRGQGQQDPPQRPAAGSVPGAEADEHDHDHDAEAGAADSLELSEQARKNIGLELMTVELRDFERTISVPGMIVEQPGRTSLEVSAPLTGIVTKIYPIQGQAVEPGQPLFDLRLTHEDLVQAQAEFLRTAEELDVIRREVERLQRVAAGGAIAGKTLLERQYEQQKQEAVLRAQRQALLLHELSEEQVDKILADRSLLQSLTVTAPDPAEEAEGDQPPHVFQVEDLKVNQGQHVAAGDELCILADHAVLQIEGTAFERDIPAINQAAAADWEVSAVVDSAGGKSEVLDGLLILYLANRVEADSRALHFYVNLPNRLLRRTSSPQGRSFVYWQYRPGQRVQILVPVEKWSGRIVLPADAVAQEGAETFVFQVNGNRLERRPVHVEYRDQRQVVIANDGSIFPGDRVAASGAHQLQLALKNQSGGAVDPHAGHNH